MDNKGQSVGIIQMIAVAVVIIVGVVVFSSIDTSFATGSLTAGAQAAKGNVTVNTYAGFMKEKLQSVGCLSNIPRKCCTDHIGSSGDFGYSCSTLRSQQISSQKQKTSFPTPA